MTPQDTYDFTIVTRAGLTQKEFAVLCGVSRVTANLWVQGKMRPHRYIKTRASQLVALLEKAVLQETLPLPDSVKSLDRHSAVKAALTQAASLVAI